MSQIRLGSGSSLDFDEETFELPLQVKADLPDWLQGSYVINGPVNFKVEDFTNHHWLDGAALIHKFDFTGKSIIYSNRLLRSYLFKSIAQAKETNYEGFQTNLPKGLFYPHFLRFKQKLLARPENANANVFKLEQGKLLLVGDFAYPVVINEKDLEISSKELHFTRAEFPQQYFSSHPLSLSKDFLYGLKTDLKNKRYSIFRLKASGDEEVFSLPRETISYCHSFAATKSYFIIVEQPLVYDDKKNASNFMQQFEWQSEIKSNIIVICRQSGVVVKEAKTVPFFFFHIAASFESDSQLLLDIVAYDDPTLFYALKNHARAFSEQENVAKSKLVRFQIPINDKPVTTDVLFKNFAELPAQNPNSCFKDYKFLYLSDVRDTTLLSEVRPIYKINVRSKEVLSWQQEGVYPGECCFISGDGVEDEGLLICLVSDTPARKSALLILDSKNMQELARAYLPYLVPPGLHGNFFKI